MEELHLPLVAKTRQFADQNHVDLPCLGESHDPCHTATCDCRPSVCGSIVKPSASCARKGGALWTKQLFLRPFSSSARSLTAFANPARANVKSRNVEAGLRTLAAHQCRPSDLDLFKLAFMKTKLEGRVERRLLSRV
jgi:hypothetical protein